MRVRVKICGITNPADAEQAAAFGADAIGLNFYAKSPRAVDEATARKIVQALPPFVEPVGVFVHESVAEIERIARSVGIRMVQLYGEFPQAFSMPWIACFSVADEEGLGVIDAAIAGRPTPPAAILVDAHVPGMLGGTGQLAPWHLLAKYRPGVPVILAGGLTPDNVADAIRVVAPFAVDVASGVESSPGKKDPEKMRRFIDAVRSL